MIVFHLTKFGSVTWKTEIINYILLFWDITGMKLAPSIGFV